MAKSVYEDSRYKSQAKQIAKEEAAALEENDALYDGMVEETENFIDESISQINQHEQTQLQNQQDRTDFTIDTIEQKKEQAHKDYLKEQSGAYVDWQKQSNQYGVNAEKQAAAGLAGSGYSESSQVSMYNTYQTRVATAREAWTRASLDYDNAIKDAQMQNSVALAEIAYQAFEARMNLTLQGFEHKNQLLQNKATAQREIKQTYYGRYQDAIAQINTENALAEDKRQFDASMAFEREQFNWQKEQAEKEEKRNATIRSSKGSRVGDDGNKGKTEKDDDSTKTVNTGTKENTQSAMDYFEALIASGATKDRVVNELAIAREDGKITTSEYVFLYNKFAPRGVQY